MHNLIIWHTIDYIILFILWFLPLLYKLFFWLYTIQLKEYRWDRFNEYLSTKQWKSAIFNIFSILDITLLLYYCFIWYFPLNKNIYTSAFWLIWYNIFFFYLIFLNIFVIWKIFRKKNLKPKLTIRILILLWLFIIWWVIDLYFFYSLNFWNFTYIYILTIFIFMPIILFFYNWISLPIVNYKKNKIIKNAIKKSSKLWERPIRIAITWSYWKSSVKEFLSSILEQKYNILKTPENINTELGVSSIVLNKLNNNYDFFIAEIWAYRIWEIKILWEIVNHKYGFITAIWNQHLWLFWSQENILKGKFEILEKIKENNGFLYVNSDNRYIENYLAKINTTNIIRYWIKSEKACAKSKILEINDLKTKFEFNYNWINEIFETNLIWEHNILNLTWILAFSYDIWLKTNDLKKYLLNINKPKNTQEIINLWENILIDDTYNLSEAGLKSWLNLLKYFKYKQKILVLDDILELWRESESIHFEIAKKIAKKKQVDKILFVWVNYKKSFIDWLIEWWFDEKNILSFFSIKGDTLEEWKGDRLWNVILFEWRNAKKYLNKLNK